MPEQNDVPGACYRLSLRFTKERITPDAVVVLNLGCVASYTKSRIFAHMGTNGGLITFQKCFSPCTQYVLFSGTKRNNTEMGGNYCRLLSALTFDGRCQPRVTRWVSFPDREEMQPVGDGGDLLFSCKTQIRTNLVSWKVFYKQTNRQTARLLTLPWGR